MIHCVNCKKTIFKDEPHNSSHVGFPIDEGYKELLENEENIDRENMHNLSENLESYRRDLQKLINKKREMMENSINALDMLDEEAHKLEGENPDLLEEIKVILKKP